MVENGTICILVSEHIANALKGKVRVIDTEQVKKVEVYNEWGVGLVINKNELTDIQWKSFKAFYSNEKEEEE